MNERLAEIESGLVSAVHVARDGRHGVYLAEVGSPRTNRLFAFDLEQPHVPLDLGVEPRTARAGLSFDLSPEGGVVVCTAATSDSRIGLFAVRPGASPYLLSGPMLPEGNVWSFALSPDGAWVLYRADAEVDGRFDLYLVPSDASQPARRLAGTKVSDDFAFEPGSRWFAYRAEVAATVVGLYAGDLTAMAAVPIHGPLDSRGDVSSFRIAPDGRSLAYLADQEQDGVDELYGVALGPAPIPVKLNGPLAPGGDVLSFQFAPSARRLVYVAREDSGSASELYSVDAGLRRRRLNPAFASGGNVREFKFTADGQRVVYLADQEQDGRDELFLVPSDGSGASRKLSRAQHPEDQVLAGFTPSPDGQWVQFVQQSASTTRLFGARIDVSAAPSPLLSGVVPGTPRISPDSRWAVCVTSSGVVRAPLDGNGAPGGVSSASGIELVAQSSQGAAFVLVLEWDRTVDYSRNLWFLPLHAPERRERVSYFQPFLTIGDVYDFQLSPDGREALYIATQDSATRADALAVPVDGARLPVWLNEAASTHGGVLQARYSPDGASVALRLSPDDALVVAFRDGITPRRTLASSTAGFWWSADSQRIVYAQPDFSRPFPFDVQLFTARVDGSEAPRVLNGVLTSGGAVLVDGDLRVPGTSTQLTKDSRWVVYLADQDTDDQYELYLAPIDASRPARRLSGALVATEDVFGFRVSDDSRRAVYLAGDLLSRTTLHVVSLANPGSAMRIADGPTGTFEFTPAGNEVVYLRPSDGGLYRASVTGGSVERLSADGERVEFFAFAEGERVLYQSPRPANGSVVDLYSVPPGTPSMRQRLSPSSGAGPGDGSAPLFLCTPDGRHVAFHAFGRLLLAPVDGSGPAQVLDEGLRAGTYLLQEQLQFSADGSRLAYLRQDEHSRYEVFAVLTEGGRGPKRVHRRFAAWADLQVPHGGRAFTLTPDGTRLLFLADALQNEVTELFSSPVDFGPRPRE